jgi:hypothetical protein
LIDQLTPTQLTALWEVGASVAREVVGDRCADDLMPDVAPQRTAPNKRSGFR